MAKKTAYFTNKIGLILASLELPSGSVLVDDDFFDEVATTIEDYTSEDVTVTVK